MLLDIETVYTIVHQLIGKLAAINTVLITAIDANVAELFCLSSSSAPVAFPQTVGYRFCTRIGSVMQYRVDCFFLRHARDRFRGSV